VNIIVHNDDTILTAQNSSNPLILHTIIIAQILDAFLLPPSLFLSLFHILSASMQTSPTVWLDSPSVSVVTTAVAKQACSLVCLARVEVHFAVAAVKDAMLLYGQMVSHCWGSARAWLIKLDD